VRGGGGIRTHEELAPLAVFETAALGRYATPPEGDYTGASQHVASDRFAIVPSSSRHNEDEVIPNFGGDRGASTGTIGK
jgi:hypothetical protein